MQLNTSIARRKRKKRLEKRTDEYIYVGGTKRIPELKVRLNIEININLN